MENNKHQIAMIVRALFITLSFLLSGTFMESLDAQSMVVESLTGPVTQNEITSFKAYMRLKVQAPAANDANIWVYGNSGKAIEACGLMYEASGDTAILNRMIYYCDAALAGRNDLASAADGGQRIVWTGKIEPVWPSSDASTIPAGAGVEQGSVLSHIAYCAKLILKTPSLWNLNVSFGDPKGFGTTYKARAIKYIQEGDYVIDHWILPHFIRTTENNHYYFPGAPNTYKPEEPAPWNQAWMLTDGFIRLVECHLVLGDSPERVAQYDSIVQPNVNWFMANLKANASVYGSPCWTWAYALPSGMEDTNHFAYDCEGLWIAYNCGRYGIKFKDMLPFANTYFDVVLATVNNGLYAGRVDGTYGTGHAAGDNYVRDEYIYFTEFRPEKYLTVGNIEINKNKVASSPQITGRLLWEKSRRYASPDTIFIQAGANGTISPNNKVIAYPGTDQNFVIIPDNGYRIKEVLIDGKSQGLISSFIFTNISCNHTISASFEGTGTGVAPINTENISDFGFEMKLSCRSNPASSFTYINYFLPSNQEVTLGIYNINGQRIKQLIRETQNSGRHEVPCNVSDIPNGIYYVLLSAGNLRSTSKLIIAN